jgi:UDP-N-acetylmuramate: L-alanyl-gamma-D-glutamyl-meso-diaminopimelate ligase
MQHIHILGICGTFMAGLAQIAQQAGFRVTGSDEHVYPPMSTQLEQCGIEILPGDALSSFNARPQQVIIGNALSRGHPAVEFVLSENLPYISGPQWLHDHVLQHRWVLAVAGTHGKTTTSSLIAWILDFAKLAPGFLIGGVTNNFSSSARLGQAPFFVIEADEYDSAFFDKRSKFMHYNPKTLILNNLEYDHSDIFPNLAAIEQQFHYGVRLVPQNGLIIRGQDAAIDRVMAKGVWTPQQIIHQDWQAREVAPDGSAFQVYFRNEFVGQVRWSLVGEHNVHNGLAAIAAAAHVGVSPAVSVEALATFAGIKRRLEVRGCVRDITVYDDFAHHPTAIQTTLQGLRRKVGHERIIAILDFASYSMRTGEHQNTVVPAVQTADCSYFAKPAGCTWPIESLAQDTIQVYDATQSIIDEVVAHAKPKDHIVVMSNRGFEGIHQRLLSALQVSA